MFYEFAVSVPPNTPAATPLITSIQLVAGRVTAVQVQFPDGCVGLVHAAIRQSLHQVWPTNSDGSISANGFVVEFAEQYDLDEAPYDLDLVLWSDDDTFPHTVTFRFVETPAALIAEQASALSALLYLDKWFSSQGGAAPQGGA